MGDDNQGQVTVRVPLPQKFDTSVQGLEAAWRKFRRQWDNYEVASRLATQDTAYRAAVFKTCLSDAAQDVCEGLPYENAADKNKIEKILTLFTTYCQGETCEVYETYKFRQRRQQQGETVDAYVGALRQLASSCEFKTFTDRMLRDQLVFGLVDDSVRQKLLQEKNLDLAKCIELCRVHEASALHAKSMATTAELHQFNGKGPKKGHRQGYRSSGDSQGTPKDFVCKYCGKSHKKGKQHCKAYGQLCKNCGKKNHFASQCMMKKSRDRSVHEIGDNYEDDDDYAYDDDSVLSMHVDHDQVCSESKAVYAKMLVGLDKFKVIFQLDSGASVNTMSVQTYKTITGDRDLKDLPQTNTRLRLYDKTAVQPVGERILPVFNPKTKICYKVRFVVVEGKVRSILGCRAIQHMKLISVHPENIAVIEANPSIMKEFSDVFEGVLGTLEGDLHMSIDPLATPVKLPCRQWPIAVREKVREELLRLEKLGVVTQVDTPTDWISSLVVSMKPNGQARLCIDPKPLNKALKRNEYPMKTIDDVLSEIQGAKYFSHFDMKNGFWHVVLDEESSFLTTFETPFGKYRWTRLPFGVSVAPEEFQRRVDNALRDLPGVFAVHDDVIVWGKGTTDELASQDHDKNVRKMLMRCREQGIQLNKEKVELKQREITYLGHVISESGLRADPKKIDAILDFPRPENKPAVQRLLGMVAYLQRFAPRLSEVSAPLRNLVKKDINFRWDETEHGKCLSEIKRMLSEPPVLRYFDPKGKTTVQCDASDFGLGACLLTDGQPVAFASRALTETERNYAQIEKEMLAIVFGLERFERYVYGRHVQVESDHKPLIPIHAKSLLSAPKRLQRMLLRTQKFDYEVAYKPGSQMFLADTLSRAVGKLQKSGKTPKQEQIYQTEVEKEIEYVDMAAHISVSEDRLHEFREVTRVDTELTQLMKIIQSGWPEDRKQVPPSAQPYFPFREELSVQNGLCFKAERIIIPHALREKVLGLLHQAHTGIQGCMRRAREVVYWPGLNSDVERLVTSCETCQMFQRNQPKEHMITHPIPTRPWEMVGCDLLDFEDKAYMVVVDYYSDFIEVDRLNKKNADEIIFKLKAQFARHGIPDRFISDNGPPFGSERFKEFAETWEFEHILSSPYYPQSNGKAENAVKQIKNLLKKAQEANTDAYLALLELRNVPSESMATSPCQRLFSRRTRTRIPMAHSLLKPKTCREVPSKLVKRKEKQAKYYNQGSHDLETLQPGQTVRVRMGQKWVKAKVKHQVDVRSYKLHTEDGREYRRNRRQIRATGETMTNNTGPRETTIRQTDNTRLRRHNDLLLSNNRSTDNNTATPENRPKTVDQTRPKVTEQAEDRTVNENKPKVNEHKNTPVDTQHTDCGQKQPQISSRG